MVLVSQKLISSMIDNHEQLISRGVVEKIVKYNVAFDGGGGGSQEGSLVVFVVLDEILGFLRADKIETDAVLGSVF